MTSGKILRERGQSQVTIAEWKWCLKIYSSVCALHRREAWHVELFLSFFFFLKSNIKAVFLKLVSYNLAIEDLPEGKKKKQGSWIKRSRD